MTEMKRPKDGQVFYSKRNTVTYNAPNGCVDKAFSQAEDFHQEKAIYELLSLADDIPTPRILKVDEHSMTLSIEFLEDTTLLMGIVEDEIRGDQGAAVGKLMDLYEWLDKFYKMTGGHKVMVDVNFRNFIYHNDQLYGIDFESVEPGDPEWENAMVLAMYLMYDPVQTDFKRQVCDRVIKAQGMSSDTWKTVKACLTEIEERRRHL